MSGGGDARGHEEVAWRPYLFSPLTVEMLIVWLIRARQENRLERMLQQLTYLRVLILNTLGSRPFARGETSLCFRLLASRDERGSLIRPHNESFTDCEEVFNDPGLAPAILNELLPHTTMLGINGESYRLRGKRPVSLATKPGAGTTDVAIRPNRPDNLIYE